MRRGLVEVRNLIKHYPITRGVFGRAKEVIGAVSDVSFDIYEGETLALMGESGCGKTTCGMTIVRLLDTTGGVIRFDGNDLSSMGQKGLRTLRKDFQVVFQNPQEALDPWMTVFKIIEEPLLIHESRLSRSERAELVYETIRRVGLQPEHLKRHPRELSGGEQQRVCICRALILRPRFLVLDEPTSALDVSVQARVLELLLRLKEDLKLTYLFISHDAAVVRFIADRVGIMYLGKLVELGKTEDVFSTPLHPYTRALIHSVLTTKSRIEDKEILLHGSPPSPKSPPLGCVFRERCQEGDESCRERSPTFEEASEEHYVACGFRKGRVTPADQVRSPEPVR